MLKSKIIAMLKRDQELRIKILKKVPKALPVDGFTGGMPSRFTDNDWTRMVLRIINPDSQFEYQFVQYNFTVVPTGASHP